MAVNEPIRMNETSFDLEAGLVHILTAQVNEKADAVANWLIVDVVMTKCWQEACAKWMTAWFVYAAGHETRCGITSTVSATHVPHKPDRVERLIKDNIRDLGAKSRPPPFTTFGSRYSSVVKKHYMAQVCPHCNTMQGDGPLILTRGHAFESWKVTGTRRFPIDFSSIDTTHRCVDIGRGHCRRQDRSLGVFLGGGPSAWFGGEFEIERELGVDLHKRRR